MDLVLPPIMLSALGSSVPVFATSAIVSSLFMQRKFKRNNGSQSLELV